MKDREPLALRWRRLTGLIVKESRQVLRDPSSVLIAGVMPLLLLFLFGYGVTFDPRQLDVALVVEQQSSESASFQASLENSTLFEVETGPDRRLFERALTLGELDGLIVLQADFAEKAFRAEGATAVIRTRHIWSVVMSSSYGPTGWNRNGSAVDDRPWRQVCSSNHKSGSIRRFRAETISCQDRLRSF